MTDQNAASQALSGTFLCHADIELDAEAPLALGHSPWRNRRVSNIAGGQFQGPRLQGTILQSGADWSELGQSRNGGASTMLDVRSLWRTDDEALIYVTYAGRLVIPAATLDAFRDPDRVSTVAPSDYYFRILPVFETASPHYAWLNDLVGVGLGQRTGNGVRYTIFSVD